MSEATQAQNLLKQCRGGMQGSYVAVTLMIGAVAMGSVATLGGAMSASLNDPVISTTPDLDSHTFISTHNPNYVGSTTLGSSDSDSADNSGGVGAGSAGADGSQPTDLDLYNDCVNQGGSFEDCAAQYLGDDDVSTSLDEPTAVDSAEAGDSNSGSDLGSNSQAGSVPSPEYGNAPDYGSGGGGGGLFDGISNFFEDKSLGSIVGGVASTVGRGFAGVLAGAGGAMIGGVTGLISGEGFINGAKSGWSDGWNACQDGPVLSMGCAGRAALAVAAPVIVVAGAKALGVTAALAVGFAAKSLIAGAAYTFFLNGDTLGGAWHDIKSLSFSFPETRARIGQKFSGCVDSPGSCLASIATGAAVYGGMRGASFLAGRVLQSAFVGSKLAPLFARYPWLTKVPGFRQAGRGAQGATALQAGTAAGGARYSVEGALQGGRWTASTSAQPVTAAAGRNLNIVGASVNGGRHVVRGNLAQRPMSAAARYIDPNSRVASSSGIRTGLGSLLERTFIGAPAVAAPHVAAGLATDYLTDSMAPSQNLAAWFDEQAALMENAPGFSLDQLHAQTP